MITTTTDDTMLASYLLSSSKRGDDVKKALLEYISSNNMHWNSVIDIILSNPAKQEAHQHEHKSSRQSHSLGIIDRSLWDLFIFKNLHGCRDPIIRDHGAVDLR